MAVRGPDPFPPPRNKRERVGYARLHWIRAAIARHGHVITQLQNRKRIFSVAKIKMASGLVRAAICSILTIPNSVRNLNAGGYLSSRL